MATYKVLQDIEAEDKLLGPLSLRQFIYAVIVVVLGFLMFTFGKINPALVIPFLPPAILFGFLAAPFGHDQSSEVWLLAKIRFALKPRARIWNQVGLQELVTITAPKKVERILTNGLDQYQVQSRLQALAKTIDTRGWAIKGVDVSMLTAAVPQATDSDRLVGVPSFNPQVPDYDVRAQDDMLDATNNAVAQHVDEMIQASEAAHRQALMDKMARHDVAALRNSQTPAPATTTQYAAPTTTPTPMYMPAPPTTTVPVPQTPTVAAPVSSMPPITPAATDTTSLEEAALLERVHKQDEIEADALKHMHNLNKAEVKANSAAPTTVGKTDSSSVTQAPDPGILKLANNDDLTVATIARQVHKNDPPANNEVVISLH